MAKLVGQRVQHRSGTAVGIDLQDVGDLPCVGAPAEALEGGEPGSLFGAGEHQPQLAGDLLDQTGRVAWVVAGAVEVEIDERDDGALADPLLEIQQQPAEQRGLAAAAGAEQPQHRLRIRIPDVPAQLVQLRRATSESGADQCSQRIDQPPPFDRRAHFGARDRGREPGPLQPSAGDVQIGQPGPVHLEQ